MSKRFQNKYRTESVRLRGYDYRSAGLYFITICTKDRKPSFGLIRNGVMGLSISGNIAYQRWLKIPEIHNDFFLDEFIVMPNHVHGIIGIKEQARRDVVHNVSTGENQYQNFYSGISPKKGSLSVVIRSFKSAVTKKCREEVDRNFGWQSRFYDHIIRSEKSLSNIRRYIHFNTLSWEEDKYYC